MGIKSRCGDQEIHRNEVQMRGAGTRSRSLPSCARAVAHNHTMFPYRGGGDDNCILYPTVFTRL